MPKTQSGKYKEITVKDIAKACGVSATTVSRVLSKSNYPVRTEVRNTVLQAADAMKYQPSLVLRSKKAFENEIAVLIPTMSNPFFPSMTTSFETVLAAEGFHALVYDVNNRLANGDTNQLMRSILQKRVKGILIASPVLYNIAEEMKKDFEARNVRVVLADCPKPSTVFNSVYYDYKRGSYLAAEYLIEKGHRNIVYAGLELERDSRTLRVQGFLAALREHGLPCGKEHILLHSGENVTENTQTESGEALAKQVLGMGERPSAVAVMNDMVAFGMLRCFHRMNVKIPEELSIIGFDDSVFCDMSSPTLTTVKVQSEQMGRMAAMLLLDDIRGASGSPVVLSLEPCVVERNSVADITR
jgi:DNA-binding LacI/PurR family transcriptional regulator